MSFTQDLWARAEGLRAAIHDHPFNRELAAGTLATDRFRQYMVQDSLYLAAYGRALAIAAARAPDAEGLEAFAESAKGAVVVERALHAHYFEAYGVDPAIAASTPASPTCRAYTDFLLATAVTGDYPVLVAAILPCFWVYRDVGTAINRTAAADNPFRTWIDTYADADFGEAVDRAIGLTDRAADAASVATHGEMTDAFLASTRYEWMFWDAAYRLETWPIEA